MAKQPAALKRVMKWMRRLTQVKYLNTGSLEAGRQQLLLQEVRLSGCWIKMEGGKRWKKKDGWRQEVNPVRDLRTTVGWWLRLRCFLGWPDLSRSSADPRPLEAPTAQTGGLWVIREGFMLCSVFSWLSGCSCVARFELCWFSSRCKSSCWSLKVVFFSPEALLHVLERCNSW